MYRAEHVLIGPANHAYIRIAFGKEHTTAMVLRIKPDAAAWFTERGDIRGGVLGKGRHSGRGSRNLMIKIYAA